ncbi:MAG TPA: hypothetical protein VGE24_15195 [Emticicia sp.]
MVAIISSDSVPGWIFKNGKRAELVNSDFGKIERLLENCINEYNAKQQKWYNKAKAKYPDDSIKIEYYIIDLKRYKRQYMVSTNPRGEKEVWVNCFCYTNIENWKKGILMAKDGGNCFFNLKINITKETYYDLRVNGDD